MRVILFAWFIVLGATLGCTQARAEKDFKALVEDMCACTDAACVQGVQDAAASTRSLIELDLADPAVFEARFGDDEETMAALARMEGCRQEAAR